MSVGASSSLARLNAALAVSAALSPGAAVAEPPQFPPAIPAREESSALQQSLASEIPRLREIKKALLDRGVNLRLNYLGETFGNPTGGIRRGWTYNGLLEAEVDADLGMIASLDGASFRVSAFQIHGRGFSSHNVDSYSTINWPDARPATRLGELWLEQETQAASLRLGQISPAGEFLFSRFASVNANGTFGWPTLAYQDLPSGGPIYPFAVPGARVKLTPSNRITLLAAIFNGDPSGAGFSGQQEIKNPAGINFRLKDPPLFMGEAQLQYEIIKGELAGTVKLGGWSHFGHFPDQRFGADGRSLADPESDEKPLQHLGNFAVYALVDQWLWRAPEDIDKGIGGFARVIAAPPNRNIISFYVDAGINFKGIWSARPQDEFAVAAAYSRVSSSLSALDRDKFLFAEEPTGKPIAMRSFEIVFEANYRVSMNNGWIIQPDFQYILRPRGGGSNPANPRGPRIPDTVAVGLRTLIDF